MVHPIKGYKVWRAYTVEGYRRLQSLYADVHWQVNIPIESKFVQSSQFSTVCDVHYLKSLCPTGCIVMSGIYAFKHESQVFNHRANGVLIWGEVALWGTVREYEYGYKSQFAYPSRISGFICSVCQNGTRTVREISTPHGESNDYCIALCIPCFTNKNYKFSHYPFIERNYNELMDLSMRYIGEWNP